MSNSIQSAFQLLCIYNFVCKKEYSTDHYGRALMIMIPAWIKFMPSEIFDIDIYDINFIQSYKAYKGIILYSSVGNAFAFSSNGKIFWFEYDEYKIAKRHNKGFCCSELTVNEIGLFRIEIIEALSTITSQISNSYCIAKKA